MANTNHARACNHAQRLDPQVRQVLRDRFQAGESAQFLATHYRISLSTCYAYLEGIDKQAATRRRDEELRQRHQGGESVVVLAKVFGVSRARIYQILNQEA